MYGIRTVGKCFRIIKILVFCALFSLFFLFSVCCRKQPVWAKTALHPFTDTTASRSLIRYRRDSDGIWRRTSGDQDNLVFASKSVTSLTLEKTSFAHQPYFLRNIRTVRNLEMLIPLPGRSPDCMQSDTKDSTTAAVCCFTGDIMCLRGQQSEASFKGGFAFWSSYRLVSKIFNEADFVCGNLETLISPSNPLTKECKTDENGTPLCNGPVALLHTLRKAGFDMLVTANNHCCDYGAQGLMETKENLDRYLFANTGTSYPAGDTRSGDRFCIFDVNGIRIAILSYTHLINGRKYLSPEELDAVNKYDPETVRRDIADAKSAGAEFIVVYCHWGTENTEEIAEYQKKDSETVAEAGADLIIGSHPHCLQSGRFIETSDARTVFCIYSMGNFCSSMQRDINNDTIILRLELERDPEGSINSSLSYIPCHVMHYNSDSFVVVPIDPGINGGVTHRYLTDADERISMIMEKTEGGLLPRYSCMPCQ